MSRSQYGRVERGELNLLSIEQACRAAAAVGLELSVKTFPNGDPVRDAGQLRLLERFRALLPGGRDVADRGAATHPWRPAGVGRDAAAPRPEGRL